MTAILHFSFLQRALTIEERRQIDTVNNIYLDRKRGGGNTSLLRIEPTMTIEGHALCIRWWSDAGPAGRVRCWHVCIVLNNAESPNQGSGSLNFITKTIHFLHFGILFIYCTVGGRQTFRPTNRNPIEIPIPINHSNYRNHQQNRTETINKSSRKDNNQKQHRQPG